MALDPTPTLLDSLTVDVLRSDARVAASMAQNGEAPAFDRVLRVAFALRGGVSLAVWIGGAVAEIDMLRRIRIARTASGTLHAYALYPGRGTLPPGYEQRAAAYAGALAAAGYDSVEFDVLAGASAGGLNSVFYAVAQRAGASMDAILDIWLEAGALWNLVHPPGTRRLTAPLRGDAYFWKQAVRAVSALYKKGASLDHHHPDLVAERLSVHLAATLIDGARESEAGIREGRGQFLFTERAPVPAAGFALPGPLPNGIPRFPPERDPGSGREPDEVQLLRLAYAARSTSSLPAVFEPAAIVSPPTSADEVVAGSRRALELTRAAIAEARSVAIDTAGDATADDDSLFSTRVAEILPDFAFSFAAHRRRREADPAAPTDFFWEGDVAIGDEEGYVSLGSYAGSAGADPRGRGTAAYQVIDGGVFDNIPIDRALAVAKDTVGDTFGDRALIYLDPDPEHTATARPKDRAGSTALWSVLSAYLARRNRRESAAAEIADVQRYNTELSLGIGRLASLAGVIAAEGAAEEAAEGAAEGVGEPRQRIAAYLENLAAADAAFLLDSLERPSEWQLRSALAHRDRFRSWNLDQLHAVETALLDAYRRLAAGPGVDVAVRERPTALLDAANSVLGWVRALEGARVQLSPQQRKVLHDSRVHIRNARALAQATRDAATFRVLARSSHAAHDDDEIVDDARARRWVGAWLDRSGGEPELRQDERWQERERAELRALHLLLDDDIAILRRLTPDDDHSVWGALDRAFGESRIDTVDLVSVVASTGIQPPMSFIHTYTISGDQQPADPGLYTLVAADERRRILQDRIDERVDADDVGPLRFTAAGKLAGQGLGDFQGFLSRKWRLNDWWWGRLDGASGIIRFLATNPAASAETPSPGEVEESIRVAQRALLREANAAGETSPFRSSEPDTTATAEGAAEFATRVASKFTAGSDSLWNLGAAYRTGLVTRVLGAVLRAATPWSGPRRVLYAVAVAVLRPLVVLLSLVLSPARVTVALGATGGVAWVTTRPISWPGTAEPGWAVVWFLGLSVALGVGLRVATARRTRRWRKLEQEGAELRDEIAAGRERAGRYFRMAGALAIASTLGIVVGLAERNVFLVVTWLVIGVAYAIAAAYLRGRVPTASVRLSRPVVVAAGLAFVVLGLVGPVVEIFVRQPAETGSTFRPLDLAVLLVCAMVTSAALLKGQPPAAVAVVTTLLSLAAGAAAWAVLVLAQVAVGPVLPGFSPEVSSWLAPLGFVVVWANTVWWRVAACRTGGEAPSDEPGR